MLGKSKVFAKQTVMARLDKARDMAVSTYAIDIQRLWRGYRVRKMLATCKVELRPEIDVRSYACHIRDIYAYAIDVIT